MPYNPKFETNFSETGSISIIRDDPDDACRARVICKLIGERSFPHEIKSSHGFKSYMVDRF
jgi:hypothetical protein